MPTAKEGPRSHIPPPPPHPPRSGPVPVLQDELGVSKSYKDIHQVTIPKEAIPEVMGSKGSGMAPGHRLWPLPPDHCPFCGRNLVQLSTPPPSLRGREVLEGLTTVGDAPPPPNRGKKRNFTIGKILLGHFWLHKLLGPSPRDALEGGEVPPPSRAPSLCPTTVPLTPSASLNGICDRQ